MFLCLGKMFSETKNLKKARIDYSEQAIFKSHIFLHHLLVEYRAQGRIYFPVFRSSLYGLISLSVFLPVGTMLWEPGRVDQTRAP